MNEEKFDKIKIFDDSFTGLKNVDKAMGMEVHNEAAAINGEVFQIKTIDPDLIKSRLLALEDADEKKVIDIIQSEPNDTTLEAVFKKGRLAEERDDLSAKNTRQIVDLASLFEDNINKMYSIDSDKIIDDSIPKDALHYLIHKDDIGKFEEKLKAIGYETADITVKDQNIGIEYKKDASKIVFVFSREKISPQPGNQEAVKDSEPEKL